MAYLVTDLRPGLQGFGGAFFALFCDPTLPNVSALGQGSSSVVDVLQGVSVSCPSGDAALRGVPADGVVIALSDLASSSSSPTSMVLTPELTVVVSTNTVSPLLFHFFLASAVWVETIVAAAREADIFPAVCRVRRAADVATLGCTLLVAGASSSLPTEESEMYSSMGGCGAACKSAAARTL
jgi:hypothetical protein